MSIFKDTFIPEIQGQLKARENSLKKRDVTSIKYLNSRNAWIKMSSSVNVNNTNELAKSYILQGGILKSNGGLRSGVGGTDNAYSNISPNTSLSLNERKHQRGLRPMPGINSIDIRSKSAYGSLREVVVKFQCWDIKQLEDLELLYMRPGYTVLVEWGWTPYLNNDGKLEYNIEPYSEMFTNGNTKDKIWKELFNKSKITGGNYDAMFGYVKNYSWSAREDGGYDCSTTIISIGEILESLKINYSPFTTKLTEGTKGLLNEIFLDQYLVGKYKKNILAGLFGELYAIAIKKVLILDEIKEDGEQISIPDPKNDNKKYNFYLRKLNKKNLTSDADKIVNSKINEIDVYITLDSLFEILNKYVPEFSVEQKIVLPKLKKIELPKLNKL